MSEKCKVQERLCRCVDWHEGETADWVDHLLHNYEFERLTLDYSTLEKDPPLSNRPMQQVRRPNLHWHLDPPLRVAG